MHHVKKNLAQEIFQEVLTEEMNKVRLFSKRGGSFSHFNLKKALSKGCLFDKYTILREVQ